MARARLVGIGMDYSDTSKSALNWAINNLIEEGDRIIVIHVVSPKADPTNKQLFEDTGSPLIPLEEFKEINVSKYYGLTPDPEVLDMLDTVSKTKKVSTHTLILLNYIMKLYYIIRVLLGSVSNYVVQNASCPVTVVKGTSQKA
ncbi:adenine nucleotide alpha hydrolases-likesuperfamily protein [Striga asiatica]|uniref:Adenine nucleotide alpha hydrolases-likesuperfamily protein n=1 Tax=Striga asiatica TaxID=4170 RepID=A0A5A7QNW9_STRAF|nr:adenine nucleotide alpha hydrolases-likesuperfamily protein [Striga asiatica]